MADLNTTSNQGNNANQTMQRENAKSEVSGGSDRMREQGGMDKKSEEKSAIGGQSKSDDMSKDKSGSEFDKNRSSEPTGQR